MSAGYDKNIALMSMFGMVLVVLGHSCPGYGTAHSIMADLHVYLYSFHMPLFFFISGYLYSLTNPDFSKLNGLELMTKKWNRLVIPYLFWGMFWFVAGCFVHPEREYAMIQFVAPHWSGSTMGYLWFLMALFVIFVVAVVMAKAGIDLGNTRTALCVVSGMWLIRYLLSDAEVFRIFEIGSVLWYMPFFIIGIQYQRYNIGRYFIRISNFLTVLALFAITLSGICILRLDTSFEYIFKIGFALIGIVFVIVTCNVLLQCKYVSDWNLGGGYSTYTCFLLCSKA